jgi:hypothetical protein
MVVPIRFIEAKIDAPAVVEVPAGATEVEIAVRTELTNSSEHDIVLHAPNEDEEIFWHVLDEKHREVLREKPPKAGKKIPGVEEFRSVTVASGHAEHETETLVLAAKKLKAGMTYVIRAEIYGQIAETEFVAIAPPKLERLRPALKAVPKAEGGEAGGKKKPTVKKSAGKKSAGKKAAAKPKAKPAKKKPA